LTYTLTSTGVKASFPANDVCENPTVEIPGIDGIYQALQFHIHTSSEHTINDKHFGGELHIVHQEVGGDRYAVVGMMIEPDSNTDNDIFGQLLDGWQSVMDIGDSGCAIARGGRQLFEPSKNPERRLQNFSPYDLLADDVTFYHYDGGLTTPPCSEVVWWNLADTPVSVSPSQYRQFVDQVLNFMDPTTCESGSNAGSRGITSRPVQPMNGRSLERVCPAGFGPGTEAAQPKCATVEGEDNESGDESSAATYPLSALVAASLAAAVYFF
jgi:carbonic anhydrase